jgi:hypothetical protein
MAFRYVKGHMLRKFTEQLPLYTLYRGLAIKRTVSPMLFVVVLSLSGCLDDDSPTKQNGTRLRSYTEYFNLGETDEDARLTVSYEYNDSGKVMRYTIKGYDPDLGKLTDQRYFIFEYDDERVSRIEGFFSGSSNPYIEYDYNYSEEGRVQSILEKNHSAGISSQATFTYTDNNLIKISYTYSNGGSFEYEFDYINENIATDKTTRGSQLCSNGEYTYDNQHNPFKELGYVDYLLSNVSSNNKLTESVNYVGCAFPTLVPESYTYDYNDDGYPIRMVTRYKSTGAVRKSTREYFYEAD